MPTIEDVFDAGGYPEYTYVKRERGDLEDRLLRVLRNSTSGASIVGPSKSGKTVLVERVTEENGYNLVKIRGQQFSSAKEMWNIVLDELDFPQAIEEHSSNSSEEGDTTGGQIGASGTGVNHSRHSKDIETSGRANTFSRRGLIDLINEVDLGSFVLLIDDFHYIDKDVQQNIAQSIKGALEEGVSICVAFVAHRGETLQRLNPDLDSRIMRIECELWEKQELMNIVRQGEKELNIQFPDWLKQKLATNAIGSPMIMQRLCQAACRVGGVLGSQDPEITPNLLDVGEDDLEDVIDKAIDWIGKRSVVNSIESGVNSQGRVEYDYGAEEKGDTYVLGLRAIANGSPDRTFHFDDLKMRIQKDCLRDSPNGPQIENFCTQMQNIAEKERPNEEMVSWDSDNRVLTISDPELLFQIRHMVDTD